MNRILPLALLLLAGCGPAVDSDANNSTPPAGAEAARLPLMIRSARAPLRFDVEVAITAEQQEQGLMFRKSVDADGGMLFPMAPPRTASFWMKNTLVPLDILFVRTDGTIAFIKPQAVPYSRDPISAGVPVAAVLELRGGRAAELGIAEGDQLYWGGCVGPTPAAIRAIEFCPSTRP
ncbi:MAG: DUF192 domain-containing protein [Sphingobium sp.]